MIRSVIQMRQAVHFQHGFLSFLVLTHIPFHCAFLQDGEDRAVPVDHMLIPALRPLTRPCMDSHFICPL